MYGHTVVGGVVTGGLEKEVQSQNPKGLIEGSFDIIPRMVGRYWCVLGSDFMT